MLYDVEILMQSGYWMLYAPNEPREVALRLWLNLSDSTTWLAVRTVRVN